MIGIYGGTFDPVHYGHLRSALEVKETLGLDEVRFLPCGVPPHRRSPEAPAHLRLRMLELALRDAEPGFRIDARELAREGPSYMMDTLISLRQEVGDRPLCLILGRDAFAGLPSWHRWRELIDQAHLIVMRRPDAAGPDSDEALAERVRGRRVDDAGALRSRPAGFVHDVEVTQLAIAATRIRQLIRAGDNPRYLLPDSVLDLIREQKLYGDECANR
jgi:nicotinate-nucleotide adenylyltransferase